MSGTEEVTYGKTVYDNGTYRVQVVKMPDMHFETYGVINNDTKVIEQLQPILWNAQHIADQLSRWLKEGPNAGDVMDSMLLKYGADFGGKTN